jgi:hypothetical protein
MEVPDNDQRRLELLLKIPDFLRLLHRDHFFVFSPISTRRQSA